jgi:hypothetical protein
MSTTTTGFKSAVDGRCASESKRRVADASRIQDKQDIFTERACMSTVESDVPNKGSCKSHAVSFGLGKKGRKGDALMCTRKSILGLILSLCVLVGVLVFGSASALAGTGYGPSFSFGSPEGFKGPVGLTVDQANGDVYVVDQGNDALKKFSISGHTASQLWKTAMPNATPNQVALDEYPGPYDGDVFVAGFGNGTIYRFGPEGEALQSPLEGLSQPTGVTVNGEGDFFVSLFTDGTVLEYNSNWEPINAEGQLDQDNVVIEKLNGPQALAASANGEDVYVATASGAIQYTHALLGSTYTQAVTIDANAANGLTIAGSGDVFVDQGNEVHESEPSGTLSDKFGSGVLSGAAFGVGVFGTKAYVADAGAGVVDVFEQGPTPEAPATEAASEVTSTTATLHGTLNPHGSAKDGWDFAFNTNGRCENWDSTPAQPEVEGTALKESFQATGLEPSTSYTYCLVATNKYGPEYGSLQHFTTAALPPSVDEESAFDVGSSSALVQAQVNPEKQQTSCVRFEYGETTAYGSMAPCIPASLGDGFGDSSTTGDLTKLKPDTTYYFRVLIKNPSSPAGGTYGTDQTFITQPLIENGSESVSGVGSRAVTLHATLNVYQTPVTYHFEYGTTTAYGSSTSAISTGPVAGSVPVSTYLEDLSPNMGYHFRIVAESEGASETGPDVTFSTLPVGLVGLPDERAYEMVTPVNNANADVFISDTLFGNENDGHNTSRLMESAPSGNAVTYVSNATENGGAGKDESGIGNQQVAVRGPQGGWTQHPITPEGFAGTYYEGFSSDLSTGILRTAPLSVLDEEPLSNEEPEGEYTNLYVRPWAENNYHPLITHVPEGTPDGLRPRYDGASSTFSQLLFEYEAPLTDNAPAGGNDLYDKLEGKLYLVNVLPDGESEANATFGGTTNNPGESGGEYDGPALEHVISEDGSRIFWTDLKNGDLYVREDATSSEATTVQIDEAEGGPGPSGGGHFLAASADGSQVFFSDESKLTSDSTATPGSPDLYDYEVSEEDGKPGRLTDLTVDHNAGESANVQGIVGISEDGSYVYFDATGVLAAGGKAGSFNLYVYHDGEIRFIAALSREDGVHTSPFTYEKGTNGDWQANLGHRTASVTPDGTSLEFMSNQSLTGYDNNGYQEVFVYQYSGASLTCVSCSRSGEPAGGNTEGAAGFVPISYANTYLPRPISDQGGGGTRVFFDSASPLVPQDSNGVQDVYEWESDGAGSCREAEGCVYLLSGGFSETDSWLLGASESGNDVFIITRAQLTPEDHNEAFNLFDARVDGLRPPTPPICTGSGCQGVPAAPPTFATPSSVTFNGVGNFPPAGPSKSTVKRKKPTLTRAQKRAKALTQCRRERGAKKRAACVRHARKEFGQSKKKK